MQTNYSPVSKYSNFYLMAGISEGIVKEENMDSIELENIFRDIFVKCDKENEGHVKVSTLIKFIAPFIDSNDEHLFELKKILDPLDMNPIISYDSFSNAMKIWTAEFNSQLQSSFASSEKSVTSKRLSDHGIRQSTPTKESIEKGANKNEFDCGLNISNISSYSYAGSVQSACDPIILNEQINELQHHNKKLTDLLSEVRGQLAVSEEINNNMQNDLDKLKKSRQTDQKIIEDLQKVRSEFEKEREENSILIKNHNSIIHSLNFYKKENSQLRKKNLDFETEIQKNQEIINSLRHRENKQSAKIETYKSEIQMKINDILLCQEKIGEINIACNEKDSYIKEITEELQNLRSDNISLQKYLDDIANKNTSKKSDLVKSGKISSPKFPLYKIKNSHSSTPKSYSPHSKKMLNYESPIFNSPKTLHMLSSPISPIENNSPVYETFSDSSKSTVIEQNIYFPKNCSESSKDYIVYNCPKPHIRSLSEADAHNITSSSIESETNPEKRAYTALAPDVIFDDECFQDKHNSCRSPSPQSHESLQAELIRASNTECFGSHTICEHKLQLIQYEEENESLNDQIRKYTEEIENIKINISEITNLNTKLQDQILLLTENEKSSNKEIQEKVEKYIELQKDNEEMFTLNEKLKSEIASIKTENKRYSRLQQKIKKLEDEIFDEKTKSDGIIMQKNALQAKTKEISLNLEQTKLDLKQLLEKDIESRNISVENSELKTKNNELSSNLEQIKCQLEEKLLIEKNYSKELLLNINELTSDIKVLKTANQLLTENLAKEENNSEKLQLNIKKLSSKIGVLEETKQMLEERLSKEENNSKELILNINKLSSKNEILNQTKLELEKKVIKEEKNAKELKTKLNDLTSYIEKIEKGKNHSKEHHKEAENEITELKLKINALSAKTEILEQTKYQLEDKLGKEEQTTNELKININQLSSKIKILEQTRQELEGKLFKEAVKVKELKLEINELNSKIQKLEKTKYNSKERDENEGKELKRKLNDLSVKLEILDQMKYQLEEKLIKEENTTTDLKLKINDLSSNVEILEQTKHHLEDQLTKEENKLKTVSALLDDITNKNKELELQNDINLSKIKKLNFNIENVEKKIQNFRKINIDLNTTKTELENNLTVISNQRDSLLFHINFTKQQIKECTDLLGKNTLLVTRVWKSDLESVILEDLPVSDLTDKSSLSGIMRMSEGKLTEDLKNLKNQTRLSGILLKSLAKIKENEALEEEDYLLSEVFSPESPPIVTQTTFFSNTDSFSVYLSASSIPSPSPLPPMSPECTQSEMTEEESHFSCVDVTDPGVSVSSPAGSVFIPEISDGSQNGEIVSQENVNGVVGEASGDTENKAQKAPLKQYRSMSEGTTVAQLFTEDGDITLFPNLQDNVLESLGLQNGEQSRDRSSERLSEEEIEAKFQTLALIFTIDAKTLAQRRELQRRQRNQADDNFAAEVARLEHGIQRLAPLCVDAETTEVVTALLTRLNIIVKAAHRMSISTQVYGGVQQEYRVAAAVNLMLVHLRNVQQQRDTARRQLQLTKRMLQENTTAAAETSSAAVSVVSRRLSTTANGRVVTRRRASIANIPRPLESPSASGPAGIAAAAKRAVRRISADAYSEHSTRPWDWDKHRPEWMPLERPMPPRLSRPSRIELNLDLTKIHEGSVETTVNNNEESDSDITAYETPTAVFPTPNLLMQQQSAVREPETFSEHIVAVLTPLARFIAYCWNRWIKNGTTGEMIIYAMILCFAIGSIMMLNIMIVSKFIRQGTVIQRIPWGWLTWDEFWSLFFDVRNTGQQPY